MNSSKKEIKNDGLELQVDNTTIHRLGIVLNQKSHFSNTKTERLNLLHLIETLIIADKIQVNSFINDPVIDVSRELIEKVSVLKADNGSSLIEQEEFNLDDQLTAAKSAVFDLSDRLGDDLDFS